MRGGPAGLRRVAGRRAARHARGTWSHLAAELLAPTLVAPATLARATAVAFPGLAGVLPGFGRQDPCDWGLGFELRDAKRPHWTGGANSPRTFGHFGQSGGFLWVDPEAKVACVVAPATGTSGPGRPRRGRALSDAVLADCAPGFANH